MPNARPDIRGPQLTYVSDAEDLDEVFSLLKTIAKNKKLQMKVERFSDLAELSSKLKTSSEKIKGDLTLNLITHGDIGRFDLGDTVIDASWSQSCELDPIDQLVHARAHIRIFACYVAERSQGRFFQQLLACLLECDVSATAELIVPEDYDEDVFKENPPWMGRPARPEGHQGCSPDDDQRNPFSRLVPVTLTLSEKIKLAEFIKTVGAEEHQTFDLFDWTDLRDPTRFAPLSTGHIERPNYRARFVYGWNALILDTPGVPQILVRLESRHDAMRVKRLAKAIMAPPG